MPATFSATSDDLPPLPDTSLTGITRVLSLTSLNAGATAPSRSANLGYANVTSSVNLSAQNAVSNQQAHSQLNRSLVGRSVAQVTRLGPRTARSSVDVLTNNELASTLADLQAAVAHLDPDRKPSNDWRDLVKFARAILAEVAAIEKRNAQLRGKGTPDDPYHTVSGALLYVLAETSLVFIDVPPDKLTLDQNIQGARG